MSSFPDSCSILYSLSIYLILILLLLLLLCLYGDAGEKDSAILGAPFARLVEEAEGLGTGSQGSLFLLLLKKATPFAAGEAKMNALWLVTENPSPSIAAVGIDVRARHLHAPVQVSAIGPRSAAYGGAQTIRAVFPRSLRRLWAGRGGGAMESEEVEEREEEVVATEEDEEQRRNNWVVNILRVRSLWVEREEGKSSVGEDEETKEDVEDKEGDRCVARGGDEDSEGFPVEDDEEEEAEEEERIVFDRDSFSRLLSKVSLPEARNYAKISYLGYLTYSIPKIVPMNLLQNHGLHFVTSSLEKRKKPEPSCLNESERNDQHQEAKDTTVANDEVKKKQMESGYRISASAAYRIAASAASYLQSRTLGILPFGHDKEQSKDGNSTEAGVVNENGGKVMSSKEASFVVTSNSVTAMVAAKEETKQAVAEDLNSALSSPCEWFICDDDSGGTRFFVIQGSETLASWQANLLFEPIQFEGLDVLVHRGIYEAAKGIYRQMLPEIKAHLNSRGMSATLRFTGHSLGGSLALLVNLMLLIRGEAPASSLLPVITFGAPCIMCGGDYLLRKLGLPKSHVQAITMHRDIVPRAFSCNYPDHVVKILKAVNGNFRNLSCLNNQKILYAPMGQLLILQPDEKFSPPHPLLPPGSGLYLLGGASNDLDNLKSLLRAAQSAFMNSPHPLEILSDRSAYGSEGTVYRDHDMNSYLKSVRCVIRCELKLLRKAKRKQRRHMRWPIVMGQDIVFIGSRGGSASTPNRHYFSFASVFHSGQETLRWFGQLVASQHLHMFIMLLLPTRLLLFGTLSIL